MYESQKIPCCENRHRMDWSSFVQKMNKTDISVIDMLNNTNPEAKEAFLANKELPKPENVYGQLDIKRVEENIATIISLKKELELSEGMEEQRESAALILEDNLKKNQFVRANYLYNHASLLTGRRRQKSIKRPILLYMGNRTRMYSGPFWVKSFQPFPLKTYGERTK